MLLIRKFIEDDRQEILSLVSEFYNSPAVAHPIPIENFEHCFDEIIKNSPYLQGLTLIYDGAIAGYCQLSITYSSEADGLVVLIEEIYVSPNFQGKGIAKQVFAYIENEYKNKAKRLRLECCFDNIGALSLYEKLGFSYLEYRQLIKEDF